jgi:hypothetical protein
LLTLRNRFASPLFVIKEELRHTWKFWMARDRFTAPNFHSQLHEVTNFAAWSNCIEHWGEGGSSDLVETSVARAGVMSSRHVKTILGLREGQSERPCLAPNFPECWAVGTRHR